MKHLDTFKERPKLEPIVGNYVLCEEKSDRNPELRNFIKNNIGKIINFDGGKSSLYTIEYENIPNNLKIASFTADTRLMDRDEIIHFSRDKNFLQTLLDANKYNL